jgi:lipoprotein-anchoring transpeptidase ErfK/SrfK
MLALNRPGAHAGTRAMLIALTVLMGAGLAQPATLASRSDGTDGTGTERPEIAPELLPADMGQTEMAVLIPESQHTLRGTMLDYWRANGGASVYGNPISEPYVAPNGYYSQAFERGIFQYLPEYQWTDDPTVRLQPIGGAELNVDREVTRADGRRVAGDRRAGRTLPGVNDADRQTQVAAEGGRFSEETGFSISGQFGAWFDSHEGWFYLGAPISEPFRHRGVNVQFFRNAMLMEQDGVVRPAPLPVESPGRYGVDTSPAPDTNLPAYSESLFVSNYNPYGVDTSTLPGRRYIVVSLSQQTLTAYQGDQVILQTLVSTGIEPNTTEIGAFHVRIKFPTQDMQGFTSSTGEVVSVGSEGQGNQYLVTDVPNVLYINYEAEALHGAYWHNNFGYRMSHGCINLPLDVAAFIYEWAPLGTAVTVVE